MFKYSEEGNDLLIDVSFNVADEAAAFSARFNGGSADTTSTSPAPPVERDLPIGNG
jgi:hypothetical protein